MSFRFAVLGVVFGVGASFLLAACPGLPVCSAATCPTGCCSAGVCYSSNQQCGSAGAACAACGLGQICSSGMCINQGSTGGGNVASGGGSASSGGGSAVGGGTATQSPVFRAYRISVAGFTLAASCYRGSVLPSGGANFPPREFEVFEWESADGQQFVDVRNFPDYPLGDSPKVSFGAGAGIVSPIAILGDHSEFTSLRTRVDPRGNDRTDTRRVQVQIHFNDLSASPSGTISMNSQYLCQGNACPTSNTEPETSSCAVTTSFTAATVAISSVWTTPTAPPVTGANKYLVAIDESAVRQPLQPDCYRGNIVPSAPDQRQNARFPLIVQVTPAPAVVGGCSAANCNAGCCSPDGQCRTGNTASECGVGGGICASCIGAPFTCNGGMCDGTSKSNDTPTLYTPALTYPLADAPRVSVVENKPIPWNGGFVDIVTHVDVRSADRTDTRRTQFSMTWPIAGAPVTGNIALQGQYLCQGNACPAVNMEAETRSCQATLPFVAVPLP